MHFLEKKKFMFLYMLMVLIGLQIRLASAATVTSNTTGNWSDPNTWQITLTKPGTVVASTNSRIVTGSALANFTTTLSVGNQILNTSNQVIGIVESIQSATSLTLTANAAIQMNNAGWNSRGVGAGDDVVIASGHTVSLDGNFSCSNLFMQIANANNTFTIIGTNTLNVTNSVLMNTPNFGFTSTINVNAGTINCVNFAMNATIAGNNNIVNITSGRLNISNNINSGASACQLNITSNGTLEIGGNVGDFAFNPGIAGSTVVYDGNSDQTMRAAIYNNLTIAGSGTKTVTTSTTVNGTLTIEGTATLSAAINTYGASAGIRYNTNIARSTDIEWPNTFAGTGGITIANTGLITLQNTKTLNANVPFQILSGASFNTNNFALTFNDNFLNQGTITTTTSVLNFNGNLTNQGVFNANSAQVRISGDFINTGTFNGGTCQFNIRGGNSLQNIDGFNTGGVFLFSKSSGTAILKGNFTVSSYVIFGSVGTILNFGTNLIHTISGASTLTGGLMQGNSSTIIFNGSVSVSSATFDAGSSTVKFTGAAQNIPSYTYFNLELGGSGVKTMGTSINTINNRLIISGTASVHQRAALNIAGDFIMNDGSFFRAAAFNLSVGDSLIIGNGSSATFRIGALGLRTFNNIRINNGASLIDSINSSFTITGHFNNSGTYTSGTGNIFLNGIDKTLQGSISLNNLVELRGSYTNLGTLTFNVSPFGTGSLTNGNSAILNLNYTGTVDISTLIASASNNTVNYIFAGNQIIYNTSYFNLGLSSAGVKSITGNLAIGGNLNTSGSISLTATGNFNIGNNLIIAGTSNINFGSFTHTIGGNFSTGSTVSLALSNSTFILTGVLKSFTNTSGTSTIKGLQIINGRISFPTNIVVADLFINTNGIYDFAGFNSNLEISNTITGAGKISAGACGTATNNLTISGSDPSINRINFDANNFHFNNLSINKTAGTISFNSNVAIANSFDLPSTGTAVVEIIADLNLYGNTIINHPSNSPKLLMSSTASLTIGSCATLGQQAVLPNNLFITTPTLKNLTLNRINGLVLGNEQINVSEVLTITTGNLQTNNLLRLQSTATKTARVAKINGSVTGDVTVERFIPGGSNKRQWRFLSSPINVNGNTALNQYQDDIFVTAPAQAAGGFDVNPFASNASIRTYSESVSGSLNNGWTNPTNINNTIPTGIGTEVFVRGSRTLRDPFLNWTVPDDVTIDYVGALNFGNISPAITFTNTGSGNNDGFNLVGNPYASPINFDTAGIIKTNIENKYWCFNPNTTLYGAYNASTGESINGMTKYISSGQAFFIRANAASPQITFTENAKAVVEGNNYYRTNTNIGRFPSLKITLSKTPDEIDESLIIIQHNSTYAGNDEGDMLKFFNNSLNLYSQSSDRLNMSMNSIPNTKNIDTINLSVWSYDSSSIATSEHSLLFSRIESIELTTGIFLFDNYLNTIIDVRKNPTYSFLINNDANSYGNNRFKVIFDKTNTSIKTENNNTKSFVLYPNPSSNKIFLQNIDINNTIDDAYYELYDAMGRKHLEGILTFNNSIASVNVSALQTGIYFIRVYSMDEQKIIKFIKK